MADPRDQERNRINGHVIPMENYGSLKSPVNDETVNFVDADELVSLLSKSVDIFSLVCAE